MRPVQRGDAPEIEGRAKVYTTYRDANKDLEMRLGKYCGYCERPFLSMLEVEHLSPKSRDRAGLTDWENFLLSCKICNTVKLAKPTNEQDFLWPDRDNTFRAVAYQEGGFVVVSDELDADTANKTRARNLVDLVGLDRHQEDGWPDPTDRDCRWEDREKAWAYAALTKRRFPTPSDEDAEYIAAGAVFVGFFSVWLTVFSDIPVVRCHLIRSFLGTDPTSFDSEGKAVPRPGGRV